MPRIALEKIEMAFTIRRGWSLTHELGRLFDRELAQAVLCLAPTNPADDAREIHDARKHVKKARAILQLMRSSLGPAYDEANESLQTANRAIGAIRDADALADALTRMPADDAVVNPQQLQAIRLRLLRIGAPDRNAVEAARERAARLIDATRKASVEWDLSRIDHRAVARAIRWAHAASRHSRRAARGPGIESWHRWRRRVKREWHLMCLTREVTGDRLVAEERALEVLDGLLGDLHDVQALAVAIATAPPLPRQETAVVLRALRGWARDLRRRAANCSTVLDESPRDREYRIARAWKQLRRGGREIFPVVTKIPQQPAQSDAA
jgi:CHAD domain-containing protein